MTTAVRPEAQQADRTTVQHMSLARLQERQGDANGAREIYEQVLRETPQEGAAHHRLGVLDAKAGRFAAAIQHFEATLSTSSPSAELLNDLGYACYLNDDLQAAEKWLAQAVNLDPQNTAAHNNLGLVLGALRRDEESLEQFRRAGSLADAYNNLAWVLTQRGDLAGARRHYLMALDADPTLKPAAEALVALGHHEQILTRIAKRDRRRGSSNEQIADARIAQQADTSRIPATTPASRPTPSAAPPIETLPVAQLTISNSDQPSTAALHESGDPLPLTHSEPEGFLPRDMVITPAAMASRLAGPEYTPVEHDDAADMDSTQPQELTEPFDLRSIRRASFAPQMGAADASILPMSYEVSADPLAEFDRVLFESPAETTPPRLRQVPDRETTREPESSLTTERRSEPQEPNWPRFGRW